MTNAIAQLRPVSISSGHCDITFFLFLHVQQADLHRDYQGKGLHKDDLSNNLFDLQQLNIECQLAVGRDARHAARAVS